jgi:hypothetical protein
MASEINYNLNFMRWSEVIIVSKEKITQDPFGRPFTSILPFCKVVSRL